MTPLVTDAIVLYAFNYLETSRILRLLTRDAGVQSVLARGARNSRKRFGSSLDLLAQGPAEMHSRPGRDLQTLVSFDVGHPRPALATSLHRFAAASALAECAMRVVHDEGSPAAFDAVSDGLDSIAAAEPHHAVSAALGALWQLVTAVGFAPTLDACANCDQQLSSIEDVIFSHEAGGALCARCARTVAGGRRLPASAVAALQAWLEGKTVQLENDGAGRAHQRLFREFLAQHVPDTRRTPAYTAWESGQLSAASGTIHA